MQFDGALVKEQGVTFAVVVVKPQVLNNRAAASQVAAGFEGHFPGAPIVLMAQDIKGRATYLGRPDLVRFLSGCHVSQLPWKRYSV